MCIATPVTSQFCVFGPTFLFGELFVVVVGTAIMIFQRLFGHDGKGKEG
jgi:hypothetical protein